MSNYEPKVDYIDSNPNKNEGHMDRYKQRAIVTVKYIPEGDVLWHRVITDSFFGKLIRVPFDERVARAFDRAQIWSDLMNTMSVATPTPEQPPNLVTPGDNSLLG